MASDFAKQADDKQLETTAQRIRARAIRRCGELLKEIEKATGPGRGKKGGEASPRLSAATSAGLSPDQAKQSIRVANVPQEDFDEQVESDTPPTITSLAEQGMAKGIPRYEQLGMTKKAFQAGMYFRGHLAEMAERTTQFDPQDVVDGSTPRERKQIHRHIQTIEEYLEKLAAKL